MKTHRDLDLYKRSVEFVARIYKITMEFPKEEIYGIVSQMRRAAISIPSNVSEGAARQSGKEFIHFLYIALGSLSELDTQIEIAHLLTFLDKDSTKDLQNELLAIKQMLLGLIKSIKNRGKTDVSC